MAGKSKSTSKPKSAAPATPAAAGVRRVVRIKSSQEGFWRAGVKHTRAAVDHDIEDFDEAQIEQLVAEPKLTVEFVDVPVEKPAD